MDGTLFDTGEGIKASARYALNAVGAPPMAEDKLNLFIGPSLYHSFSVTAGLNEETALKAVEAYRERYFAHDVYLSHPYDGISEMLIELTRLGYGISIASSKPLVMVEKLLEKYDYAKYFSKVIAPDYAHKSNDKSGMVQRAKTAELNLMVGDTVYDIDGAHGAGIKVVAVTYGYGVNGTLAAADAFAASPAEIITIANTRKDLFA